MKELKKINKKQKSRQKNKKVRIKKYQASFHNLFGEKQYIKNKPWKKTIKYKILQDKYNLLLWTIPCILQKVNQLENQITHFQKRF